MKQLQLSLTDALATAHAALLEDLQRLDEAARQPLLGGRGELLRQLDRTRAHVVEHFCYEEQQGYMDVVRRREARHERLINQLYEEHRHLAKTLTALRAEAETAALPADALREKILAWVKHLRQHEARENDLVQNVFNLDVAAED
jgi:hypothetical protein